MMKKTLLSVAIASSACASFAQSSVTISGNIDLGFYKPAGTDDVRVDSVNANSALRFSGSEDLGGGLKANFMLDQRFSPESGGADGSNNGRPTWQGETTLGLSGGFGSVKFGRAVTPAGALLSLADPWRNTRLGSASVAAAYFVNASADERDGAGFARTDGVFYSSPNLAGFSLMAAYGLKNTVSGGKPFEGVSPIAGVGLSYAQGPLGATLVLEGNRDKGRVKALFGNYDFGVANVRAGWGEYKNTENGPKIASWVLSATMPVSSAVKLSAVYGKEENKSTHATTMDKFGLGAEYAFSKRTGLYFTAGRNDAVATGSKVSWDLGLRHSF
jgi:predicted porin